ncbi:MAG: hypothetical protein ABI592_10990 [Acidobacteriota bacterium]
MSPRRGFVRASLAALAALGLFSLVFSLLAERGKWPELPPGALHDTDLAAGFVSAVALAAIFAMGKSRRNAGRPPSAGKENTGSPDPESPRETVG